MKVLNERTAEFRTWFNWWSKWVDILVYQETAGVYLIQMRLNRKNEKQFTTQRIDTIGSRLGVSNFSGLVQIGPGASVTQLHEVKKSN